MVLLYCRQLLADCFSLKGLISAVLVLWQAEHKKVCQTWMPFTCGTDKCKSTMPSQSAQNHHGDELYSKSWQQWHPQSRVLNQMCKHTRSLKLQTVASWLFWLRTEVWRPLCHGSWTMKRLGYGSAGRHAHDEKKDDGPQVAEVGPKVAEFAARQGQSQSSEESSKRQFIHCSTVFHEFIHCIIVFLKVLFLRCVILLWNLLPWQKNR